MAWLTPPIKASLHMHMGIQMVLAILIISVALRAESEFQILAVGLRPAAHRAAVFSGSHFLRARVVYLPVKIRSALHLLR